MRLSRRTLINVERRHECRRKRKVRLNKERERDRKSSIKKVSRRMMIDR